MFLLSLPHAFPIHQISVSHNYCVFLGYSNSHKGYLCLHHSGRVYISRNVVFNENEFHYSRGFPNAKNLSPSTRPPSFFQFPEKSDISLEPTEKPFHSQICSEEPSSESQPAATTPIAENRLQLLLLQFHSLKIPKFLALHNS